MDINLNTNPYSAARMAGVSLKQVLPEMPQPTPAPVLSPDALSVSDSGGMEKLLNSLFMETDAARIATRQLIIGNAYDTIAAMNKNLAEHNKETLLEIEKQAEALSVAESAQKVSKQDRAEAQDALAELDKEYQTTSDELKTAKQTEADAVTAKTDAEKKEADADLALKNAKAETKAATDAKNTAQTEKNSADKKLNDAKGTQEGAQATLDAEKKTLAGMTRAEGESQEAFDARCSAQQQKIDDAQDALDAADRAVQKAQTAADTAATALTSATGRYNTAVDAESAAQTAYNTAHSTANTARDNLETASGETVRLTEELAGISGSIDSTKQTIKALDEQIDGQQKAIDALESTLSLLYGQLDDAAYKTLLNAARDAAAALGKIDSLTDMQTDAEEKEGDANLNASAPPTDVSEIITDMLRETDELRDTIDRNRENRV